MIDKEANTPSDDQCEALAIVARMKDSAGRRQREEWCYVQYKDVLALEDALAAGFRCTAAPTGDEREAIMDALLDELGWEWDEVPEEHIPSSREILGDMADRVIAVTAGFHRTVQGGFALFGQKHSTR